MTKQTINKIIEEISKITATNVSETNDGKYICVGYRAKRYDYILISKADYEIKVIGKVRIEGSVRDIVSKYVENDTLPTPSFTIKENLYEVIKNITGVNASDPECFLENYNEYPVKQIAVESDENIYNNVRKIVVTFEVETDHPVFRGKREISIYCKDNAIEFDKLKRIK